MGNSWEHENQGANRALLHVHVLGSISGAAAKATHGAGSAPGAEQLSQ